MFLFCDDTTQIMPIYFDLTGIKCSYLRITIRLIGFNLLLIYCINLIAVATWHSTESLTRMVDSLIRVVDVGKLIGCVLVDFRKAVDLVDHKKKTFKETAMLQVS